MSTELVSVIMPTYNREKTIARAIRSVLEQTYQNLELIVVDDGSADNTEETVRNIPDSRLVYIKSPDNKGSSAARNIGIKMAKGKYIAFQDSDDEWFPEKLEKQMKVFKTAPLEVGVVYTGFWRMQNEEKIYIPSYKIKKKEGNIHRILLQDNFITTQATLVLAECFKRSGIFDENLPPLEDWELWIRISKFYEFRFIDEPLVFAYIQKDSISEDKIAFIKARELILQKHFENLKKAGKKILSKHYYCIGRWFCQHGKFNQGKVYILKASKAYPYNIKYLLIAIISLFGSKTYDKLFKMKWCILRCLGFQRIN